MELRQLRVFVAIAEEGSFTRAADRLHVVQSAVSASLRTLEQELGVTLLERTPVALTDAGQAFLPGARATLAASAAAVEAVDEVRGGLRGTVELGVMQGRGSRPKGAPSLPAFATAHPAVHVRLRHTGGSVQMAEDVEAGRLDFAVLGLPEGEYPGLALTQLGAEELALLCHEDHPLATGGPVRLEDLTAEPFADLPEGWGIRMAVDAAFAAAGLQREVAYEVPDVMGAVDFAAQHLAVTLMPAEVAVAAPALRAVPLADAIPFRISLAVPTGRAPSAAAAALAATFRREAVHHGG